MSNLDTTTNQGGDFNDKRFKRGSFKLPPGFKTDDNNQQQPTTQQPTTSDGAPQPPPSRKITLGNRNSNTPSTNGSKSPDTNSSTITTTGSGGEIDEFNLDPIPITRPRTNRAATMIPSSVITDNNNRRKPLKIGGDRVTDNNNNTSSSTDETSKSDEYDPLIFNKPNSMNPPKLPPKRKSIVLPTPPPPKDDDDDDDDEDDDQIKSFSTKSWSNIMNKSNRDSYKFTSQSKGTSGTGQIDLSGGGEGNGQDGEPSNRRGTFKKPIIIGTHQQEEDLDDTTQRISSLDLANVQRPKQQYHTIDPSNIPQWKKTNEEYQENQPTPQTTQSKGFTSTFTSILKNSPLSKVNPLNSSSGGKGLTKGEVEYNEYLQKSKQQTFAEIEKLNFIYHAGKDNLGRHLIVIIAAHLPVKETDMEKVLLYTISIMDPVVEGDYVLVYCHTNMNNSNKPSFNWLKKVYTIFNRKYKKNLKGLYIVHPTSWIKFILGLFKPFLSKKFWRKLSYIDDLTDLFKFFSKEQLNLPSHVMMHRPSGKKQAPMFGSPLEEVVQRPDNPCEIPMLFEKGLGYLERRALHVEGIFRLSGANSQIKSLKAGFDAGEDVDLEDVEDVHTVAGLLKLYLRELPQPLFPFDTYSSFIEIIKGDAPKPQKIESLKLLISLLPPANKALTKHLFKFLSKVLQNSHINKMTAVNISIVFAPNLLKDGENNILNVVSDAQYVNQVVQLILENVHIVIPQ
ncbi:RhoGAP domain-containing protein [Tieghemostelium lacteum]|uniref:RhoGAP domain-containing protein n=1 Tax=Tieghemostelium lacteum TaxID=361077 RepID=A0A152A0I9_TIELA|nr:RhoGAP domain-containing protein [Tieghemostelium lacteum]|eukprot:KYQ99745.1 RhoGAP domain-containing protein [Tieghemostelium lacteum]